MQVNFAKMHGAGNDFIMIDDRDETFPIDEKVLAKIAARGTGIGCEGVILVQKSTRADFRMRFFNPDGTEAELCGNGARCVAAFAREIGAVNSDYMKFETLAGDIDAEIVDTNRVKVVMPAPKDLRKDFVNSGVPHYIVAVQDVSSVNVEVEGRKLRNDSQFAPNGTNVDFVTYKAPNTAIIRTYERGVEAETGACGTGSVAAAIVGVDQYGMKFPVNIQTSMGYELTIDGRVEEGMFKDITLTGPVERVFKGTFNLDINQK